MAARDDAKKMKNSRQPDRPDVGRILVGQNAEKATRLQLIRWFREQVVSDPFTRVVNGWQEAATCDIVTTSDDASNRIVYGRASR